MKLLSFEQGLRPRDKALVAAFVEREVMDFRIGWMGTPMQIEALVSKLVNDVEDLLRNAPAAEEIRLHSLGNTGCIVRELRFEPKKYNSGDGFSSILVITFDTGSPKTRPGLQILRRKWKTMT